MMLQKQGSAPWAGSPFNLSTAAIHITRKVRTPANFFSYTLPSHSIKINQKRKLVSPALPATDSGASHEAVVARVHDPDVDAGQVVLAKPLTIIDSQIVHSQMFASLFIECASLPHK